MGSRKNKFSLLGIEAPALQGAKVPRKHNGIFDRHIRYVKLSQRSQAGCIDDYKQVVMHRRLKM